MSLTRIPLLAHVTCWLLLTIITPYSFANYDPLAVRLPVLDAMPNAQTAWVAKQMALNGVPMSIRSFKVNKSAQEVLTHYNRKWKTHSDAHIEPGKHGDFDTLGFAYNGYYHTVQVRNAHEGAEGLLVVSSELKPNQVDRSTDFPLPSNSQVVSKMESLDEGVRAETITVVNRQSASSNMSFFDWTLPSQGWVRQASQEPANLSDAIQLNFQNGRHLSQVTIQENNSEAQGQTLIMVHWIK